MHNSDYFFILIFILIAMGMAIAMFLLSKILAPSSPDSEKLSAYECGFEAFDDTRSKFDVRFYLVSILFIISILGFLENNWLIVIFKILK